MEFFVPLFFYRRPLVDRELTIGQTHWHVTGNALNVQVYRNGFENEYSKRSREDCSNMKIILWDLE